MYYFYKIVSTDVTHTECYVGCTTNFKRRRQHHKDNCTHEKRDRHNLLLYKHIRSNGGWDNWRMIELERRQCADKIEALRIERKWLEELKATLNKIIPSRSKKEYSQLPERKEKDRQWREKNQERRNAEHNEWYRKNREEIQKKRKEQIECAICNCTVTYVQYQAHLKRKKHLDAAAGNPKQLKHGKIHCDICDCDVADVNGQMERHEQSKKHQANLLAKTA